MNQLLVSVIIPVYNGERYLAEALDSVLSQKHPADEIIVIDDGSTDGSAQIIDSFRPSVTYHWQPNAGAGAARNLGVTVARGAFLAFLDADDLWTRDKLERQLAAFAGDSTLDMVFGHVYQYPSPELDDESQRRITIGHATLPGLHPGAMLIKREAFLRVGAFRTDLRLGEFIDWHARATELKMTGLMLPDVVMKRRIHKTNQGTLHREARGDYARVLKAALDRRRKQENK